MSGAKRRFDDEQARKRRRVNDARDELGAKQPSIASLFAEMAAAARPTVPAAAAAPEPATGVPVPADAGANTAMAAVRAVASVSGIFLRLEVEGARTVATAVPMSVVPPVVSPVVMPPTVAPEPSSEPHVPACAASDSCPSPSLRVLQRASSSRSSGEGPEASVRASSKKRERPKAARRAQPRKKRPKQPSAAPGCSHTGGGAHERLPSMTFRSRAEVAYMAQQLYTFGCCTRERLIACLLEGDDAGKVDAVFTGLPGGLPDMAVEYDPGCWHGEDRLADDRKKTHRMLCELPDTMFVCRVRLDAPTLTGVPHDDPRLVIVEASDRRCTKHGMVSAKLAHALAECCSGPSAAEAAEKLASVKLDAKNSPRAVSVAHSLLLEIDLEYARDVARMSTLFGAKAARKLLKTGGVKSRVPEVLKGIAALQTELKLTPADALRLVNDCSSSRVDNVEWRRALIALKQELELTTAQLVSIASNDCTAKRVEHPGFRTALGLLKSELQLTTAQLVSVASNNCTAKRAEEPGFRTALGLLKSELQLTTAQLVSVASNNCTTKRVEEPGFRTALGLLKKELQLTTAQLVSIASNDCTANRVEGPGFRAALGLLKKELQLTTAQLVSIASNGCMANRVEQPGFRTALGLLKSELKLTTAQLVSIASNDCTAKRVEEPYFRTALGLLKKELQLTTAQLVSIANNDCTANRVEEPGFRAALGLLKSELELTTAQLVSVASNNCTAKRVEQPGFRAVLARVAMATGTDGLVVLLQANNDQLASRLTPTTAAYMARVARRCTALGLDGGACLHTLLGHCIKMIEKLEALAARVESLPDRASVLRLVNSCKGDANSKRDVVAASL